jgi:formylglycine-generating enzyme required for sulfatase activity
MRQLLVFVALFFSLPAQAASIDWVPIANPNNTADTLTNCQAANCGSVDHAYYISKYEVTNAQYADLLNAKAAADPLSLYNTAMGSDATFGGITRSGVSGSYTYTAKLGFENKPVVYVSFYDALRFSNWLNNGEGSGDTETGAYTLLGGTATPSNGPTVTRNGGANTFLTSENEWYKAAYYSPGGVYFDYPMGTDSVTGCVAPGSDTGNSANCNLAVYALTDAGAYGLSASPYGTFDQGGNVWEWNEQIVSPSHRGVRGGSYFGVAVYLAASDPDINVLTNEYADSGFRVASLVPEPGTSLLAMTSFACLAALLSFSGRGASSLPGPGCARGCGAGGRRARG